MSSPTLPRSIDAASIQGMLLGAAAYTMFSLHDALVKGMIDDLPVTQILFCRSVVITIICMIVGRAEIWRGLIKSPNKPMLLLRAVLTLAAWCMYYPAGQQLQLAEITTLYYVAPVITIVLAVIFLHERLTLARVGAAAIGLFGVVVAANPAGLTISAPALMALGAAFLWAVAMILMRTISKSESSMVLVFSINLFYVVVLGVIAIPTWHAMTLQQVAATISTGLIGGFAQFILIEAARRVPASVLGTVEYSALIWSFVLGFLFFSEQPTLVVFIGAAMVMAAGLLLAWSERAARRKVVDAP